MEKPKGNCRETIEAMYAYIDREVDKETRVELGKHLDSCSPCFEAFEFEAELKAVVGARCRDEVPDHLYAKVRASLRAELQKLDDESQQSGIPEA